MGWVWILILFFDWIGLDGWGLIFDLFFLIGLDWVDWIGLLYIGYGALDYNTGKRAVQYCTIDPPSFLLLLHCKLLNLVRYDFSGFEIRFRVRLKGLDFILTKDARITLQVNSSDSRSEL